jgi:hypothetical protein
MRPAARRLADLAGAGSPSSSIAARTGHARWKRNETLATRNNARVTKAKRNLQAVLSSATPEEAAAIVAALARFMADTAPRGVQSAPETPGAWHATAMLESVSRDPWGAVPGAALADPWINT